MPMNCEIVSIGNEVISGAIVNSNASWIANELFLHGFHTHRHTSLPDEEEALKNGLKEALERSTVVIATGGLGPTLDDLSRDAAAALFESTLQVSEEIKNDLIKRFGPDLRSLEHQSLVPNNAQILQNTVGTASGFLFSNPRGTLILLPGVPAEMKPMFQSHVLPYLEKNFPKATQDLKKIHFVRLFESDVDPTLRDLKKAFPHIRFGIYPQAGTLTATLTGHNLEQAESALIDAFKDYIYESTSGKIDEAVHKILISKKLTLSVAESMTGGALSQALTRYPESSTYFLGGLVAYSNQAKIERLGVPEDLIRSEGAVSKAVALAMAQAAIETFQSDLSLAVTGIAGPGGGSEEKPVGTVWCAIGFKDRPPIAWLHKGYGTRNLIIGRCVNILLGELYLTIKNGSK